MLNNFEKKHKEQVCVSIVLLTRNQERFLSKSFPLLVNQNTDFSYEIIALCTKSRDKTLELCRRYCTKTLEIPKENFHHAKTRNLGIKLAKGEYIVFLVGDAVPFNTSWLQNLVIPLTEDIEIMAGYSKQIPHPEAPPWEKRDILYGNSGITRRKIKVDFSNLQQSEDYTENPEKYIKLNNISTVYRSDFLNRHPFDGRMVVAEDRELCKRIIELGYAILFIPESKVFHSHDFGLKQLYYRCYTHKLFSEVIAKTHERKSLMASLTSWISQTVEDIFFLVYEYDKRALSDVLKWLPKIFFVRLLRELAFWKVCRKSRR